jgi:Arc/MetJ-type ribon-helix-helix transcriptional regulator
VDGNWRLRNRVELAAFGTEFGNASEVVREALRLLREQQENRARAEVAAAFDGVDSHGGPGEPTSEDRALIGQIIRRCRKGRRRA